MIDLYRIGWYWHLRAQLCNAGLLRCEHCRRVYVDRARTVQR